MVMEETRRIDLYFARWLAFGRILAQRKRDGCVLVEGEIDDFPHVGD
jgi:hypothetical protein